MVVLVSGQGCAAREGLLAVLVGALVWPLSRVNPAMPGQGTAIAEGLYPSVSCFPLARWILCACLPCHISRTGVASRQYARADEQSGQSAG